MAEGEAGQIVRVTTFPRGFSVECGICDKRVLIYSENSVQAEEQLRGHGWSDRQLEGWVCWEHQEK